MFKPMAANTQIELCLATIKPNGEDFDGITWHLIPDFQMNMTYEVMETTIFDPDKYIYIDYGDSYPGNQITELSIHDHFGKVLLKKSGTDITRISLTDLPPGFYILQLKTDHAVAKEKFIKSY